MSIGTIELTRRMIALDLRLVFRDRLLAGLGIYIVLMVLVFRYGFPALSSLLAERYGLDISPWAPLVSSYVAVNLSTLLVGMMFGFVLLEQVEERTLLALRVMPVHMNDVLLYRAGAPLVLGFVLTPLCALGLGVDVPETPVLLVISAVGSLQGSLMALFLPAFADNRVQAFAVSKVVSAAGLLPIVAYFTDEPVQFFAGVFPTYWVLKAWWAVLAGDGRWPLFLLFGAVGLSGLLFWFVWRTRRNLES